MEGTESAYAIHITWPVEGIAVACPEWRGLKERSLAKPRKCVSHCSGLPRMEGTERIRRCFQAPLHIHIAVACPEWRGLKVEGYTKSAGSNCHCSGLPRMEGTESANESDYVQFAFVLQWLAPNGGD